MCGSFHTNADKYVFIGQARHILLSTDGPYENVLKIKPPMVFGFKEVDRLVSTMKEVLSTELLPLVWKRIIADEEAFASKVIAPRMALYERNEAQIFSSLSPHAPEPASGLWSLRSSVSEEPENVAAARSRL